MKVGIALAMLPNATLAQLGAIGERNGMAVYSSTTFDSIAVFLKF